MSDGESLPLTRVAVRHLTLLVVGLITACSSDDPHARDVRACRSEATRREVEMQGPNNQPTVLTNGYDQSIYERCMRKRGWTDGSEEPVPLR